jgi:hypothetical protein
MTPRKPLPDPAPSHDPADQHAIPDIDDRANQAFLDALIDTDGRPMRDAIDMPEDDDIDEDGFDEDDLDGDPEEDDLSDLDELEAAQSAEHACDAPRLSKPTRRQPALWPTARSDPRAAPPRFPPRRLAPRLLLIQAPNLVRKCGFGA